MTRRTHEQRPTWKRTDPDAEGLARTARALRIAYGTVLPRQWDELASARLGYSSPCYNRQMSRGHAFFLALGEEIGEWWWRMAQDAGRADLGAALRVERRHMADAAEALAATVERLPLPLRDVVVMRAVGTDWVRIEQALVGRVYFSLADDWTSALRRIWREAEPEVARLAVPDPERRTRGRPSRTASRRMVAEAAA